MYLFHNDLQFYVVVFIIDLIVAISAFKMAHRKDRADSMWALFCFLFLPLILILWILPDRSWNQVKKNGPAQLHQCAVCNGPISSDAQKCPTCGAKNIFFARGASRAFEYVGLITATICILCAIFMVFYTGQNIYLDRNEFPACESYQTKSLSENIYQNIPLNHYLRKKIVTWHSIEQIGPHSCKANILSSSGSHENIHMEYSVEDDHLIMRLNIINR